MGSSAHSEHWTGGQRPIYRQEIQAEKPVAGQGPEARGWCWVGALLSAPSPLSQLPLGCVRVPPSHCCLQDLLTWFLEAKGVQTRWPWGNFRGLSGRERRSVQSPGLKESPLFPCPITREDRSL